MSPEQPNGRITTKQVYDLVGELRTEVMGELQGLRQEVHDNTRRQDRMDGALAMLKWLGPAGLGAVILGLLKIGGVG